MGGDALLPHLVVVGGLGRGLHLHRPPPVHPPVRLAEEVRQVLRALLPLVGVPVSPGGGRGGGVARRGRLPVDVARRRPPGREGRAGERGVRGGLGDALVLQVGGGDGDGERGVEVVLRRPGLVDVRLLFGLHGRRLEGWRSHGLILGEVHEGEALVVAPRRAVSCKEHNQRRVCVGVCRPTVPTESKVHA